ncbi:glutathione S-transferase-like [Brevipalpus obovatus]|uniref:glutathione S-transferase-like n=1 Tax=Brevipalpus obovatus TaxID=246614 RepID=UPI003D9E2CE3
MAPILGYWNTRALGDPIRLLLTYAGVEFEDKRYQEPKEWFSEKFNLGFDFPNIPYYIDGDLKLTQFLVIMRYLARKHGMFSNSDEEVLRMETGEQMTVDILWTVVRVWFNEEALKDPAKALADTLPSKLDQWSTFIGDGKFVLGDTLTYVDFFLYSVLDYIRIFVPDFMVKQATLQAYLDRIEALPAINKYINSDKFNRMPITGPSALWGNKPE